MKNKKKPRFPKAPASIQSQTPVPAAPAASPVAPAVSDGAAGHLTIEEATARLQKILDKEGQWDEVVSFAEMPIESFLPEARTNAALFLSRVAFYGLVKGERTMPFGFNQEQRDEALLALEDVARKAARFHLLPEFEFYLSAVNRRTDLQTQALPHIAAAAEADRLSFVCLGYIREILLALQRHKRNFAEPLKPEEQAIVDQYDLVALLRKAMGAAAHDLRTDAQDSALLAFLELDLEARAGQDPRPFDFAERIRQLPSPTVAEYRAAVSAPSTPLTAQAWAFLLECDWMSEPAQARELLARYPSELCHPLCDGIRAVLQSFFVEPGKSDVFLAKGLHLLMEFEQHPYSLGESVLLQADGQWCEVPLARLGLQVPGADGYLCCIAECKPPGYTRAAEVNDLYPALQAILDFSNLSEDDDKHPYTGLPWLFEQSLSFHQAAAGVLRGRAKRWETYLDSLIRCIKDGVDRRDFWYDPESYADEGEKLTVDEAHDLLDRLGQLVPLQSQFSEQNGEDFARNVVAIFQAISPVEPARARLVGLSRLLDASLTRAGTSGLFLRGFLEQVAGSAKSALEHYLLLIAGGAGSDSGSAGNARLLWVKSSDENEVEEFVLAIDAAIAACPTAEHVKVLRALHKEAKARLQILTSRSQFQRTAVNRWPKVSGPAMKVLSVLHQIRSFNGYGELAEYAGMNMEWARKHYDRLVELGMVLETGNKYEINPYVIPYLERESQHSVVGRIIRAQGSSAVKQVFNSNREFTIYQVLVQLCPNHLVFPNSSLQSIMSFDRMKELVSEDDFGYYLRASVDIVVVNATTYLPMLAIEVDSVWHDTERQQRNDDKKDRLFAVAGIPFMRLRPVGQPSANVIRGQVAEHLDQMIRTVRADMPGYDQAIRLLRDLSGASE